MITARFGSKQFKVESKTIYTPDNISVGESIELEETEVKGKKPKTSVKGIKLQSLSFEVKLDSRFVTVETELRYWKNILLGKKSDFFYLGNYKVGKFYLTQYDITSFTLTKNGAYRTATLSLTFTEDGTYANSKKINFESPQKAAEVKKSATTTTKAKTIKVGTTVKPKKNTRWYYTAAGAINKTGKSGKAYNKAMKVAYVHKVGGVVKAINPQGLGWMRLEDVDIV